MRLGAYHKNEHRIREKNSMSKLRELTGGTKTKVCRKATVSDEPSFITN